jgi:hypothetical protein
MHSDDNDVEKDRENITRLDSGITEMNLAMVSFYRPMQSLKN